MPDTQKQPKKPEERVLDYIRERNLVKAGELILVGVSGGPDSICLLNILDSLRNALNIRLHVAHLNHELRGTESDADAAFVARLADKLGLPVTVESRDVKSYQKEKHLTLEEAAREVRYAFFAELAAKLGAEKVAVGHTSSDQVETVLMHLIRGSGSRGLSGLQPETVLRPDGKPLTVIRPILPLSRADTEEYCRSRKLEWRTDSSNLLPETQRNRIRLELLPSLRKYNPEIEQALLRMAAIALDDTGFIAAETMKVWKDIVEQSDSSISIDKAGFLVLPRSLQRSLLRQAIASLVGDLRNIELGHIEDIISITHGGSGKIIALPDRLVFATGYKKFTLQKEGEAVVANAPFNGHYQIHVPGKTIIPGWLIETSLDSRDNSGFLCSDDGSFNEYFDFDKTGEMLFVRRWRSGDRFVPLGMSQTKTVAEFLIDRKVPRAERAKIPIVEAANQIVWLTGVRIDGRVRVTEVTKRILKMRFERI